MSQQLPLATQGVKHTSLFRRRRIGTIFALTIGLIILFLFFRSSSVPQLATVDELHGLLYMVSNTENVLPDNLDIAGPITPSTWEPWETFDSKLWKERMTKLHEETPVIVFSKSYCPYSQRAKDLLARYSLKPTPRIVEVDLRDDDLAIKSLLIRFTGRSTFPNVILQGKSLGGYDNLQLLHDTGDLERELERAGVKVTGSIHGDVVN